MKFRFCGGLEPPDWLLAEVPLLLGTDKVTIDDLIAMCQAIGADITIQELTQAHVLAEDMIDTKAVIAVLRFILTHAAKYDTKARDLTEELLQLGMHEASAKTIAQSYDELRLCIQDQQRAQRFRFPNVTQVEWKVEATSNVMLNVSLDQPVVECEVAITPRSLSAASHTLSFDMSKLKFLAFYEELHQAQSILHNV